jgi:hypothetical protein
VRDLRDASVRSLIGQLDLARVVESAATFDCDTPEDVHTIEAMEAQHVR